MGGPDLYGHYFIDRPPLLLAVFRLAADMGGPVAVRVIGAVAAAGLVVLSALIARGLGRDRAGVIAGAIAAVLGSSVLLGSVMTPAELLAALPSAGSVLLLVLVHRPCRRQHIALAFAGLLAAAALLVKQSFGDALVAGLVFLAASAYLEKSHRRRWAGLAAAYFAGLAAAAASLEVWELFAAAPDGATSYALLGFRLQGLSALAGSAGGLPARLADRLALPFIGSGLVLVVVWSVVGLRRMSSVRPLQLMVAAWGLAGIGGVLAGGSYWPHYLVELIPVASVTAALALARARRSFLVATASILLGLAAIGNGIGQHSSAAASLPDVRSQQIGEAISDRAHHGDTIYVRYSQPNITYYSGLRNPYPYDWSLMLRTIPGAQHRLRDLLRSSRRPTWIVEWEPSTSYGLDADGRTTALLDRYYRAAGEVDGIPLLLRNGANRPMPPSRSNLGPDSALTRPDRGVG